LGGRQVVEGCTGQAGSGKQTIAAWRPSKANPQGLKRGPLGNG